MDPRYKVESKSFRLELKAAIAASFTMVLKPTAPESPAEDEETAETPISGWPAAPRPPTPSAVQVGDHRLGT